MTGRVAAAVLALLPTLALAHPLAPGLLELRETSAGDYAVLWRTSVARVRQIDVTPQLPVSCQALEAARDGIEAGEAFVSRWSARCGALDGQAIAVAGIEQSGINVIVRIERRDGSVATGIVDARHPQFTVPAPGAGPATFTRYLSLGVGHLLTGLDHVLFVIGLVILVRRLRPLVMTITAFTVGHSVTLGLATLGIIHFNPAVTELGIALSILVLACQIVRDTPGKRGQTTFLGRNIGKSGLSPFSLMACVFGLLHGLGFAGALAEVGLPPREIPLALLAFNLGIESGQLMLVAGALAVGFAWSRLRAPAGPMLSRALPSYIIGSLAACWCLERCAVLASQLGVL